MGFKLFWTLDSVKFTKEHNAKNEPDMQHTMELDPDEHINFLQISFTNEGIHFLSLQQQKKGQVWAKVEKNAKRHQLTFVH